MLTEMITKMRKYLTHWFAVMRYKVIAKEVFPVVVAMIPKHATMMVLRLIVLRSSALMVSICRPKPSETMYVLMLTLMTRDSCSIRALWLVKLSTCLIVTCTTYPGYDQEVIVPPETLATP
jgi:hypothetical protein